MQTGAELGHYLSSKFEKLDTFLVQIINDSEP